jgi:hypothetical protein
VQLAGRRSATILLVYARTGMRIESDSGDFLEIERADAADACDLPLVVRLKYRGFTATIDCWVQRTAWFAFAQDLSILEQRGQGEAKVESTSPGELSISIRSLDRAGHMGVEGTLGIDTFEAEASLRFSSMAFDPSQLVRLALEARGIARTLSP